MNDASIPVTAGGAAVGFVGRADWQRTDDDTIALTLVHGQQLRLPRSLLDVEGDALRLDLAGSAPNASGPARPTPSGGGDAAALGVDGGSHVIPVVEERLEVGRRSVEKGVVRLRKRVETTDEPVELTHLRREARVERRPVGQIVDEAPSPRQEGNFLIVPVLEEVQIVETRLMLREELVVWLEERTDVETVQVRLRRETVDIERSGSSEAATDAAEVP